MLHFWCIMLIGCLLVGAIPAAYAREDARRAQANHLIEWTFASHKAYADPFNEVTLDAVFTRPDGTTRRVPAFWAGGQTWRVRYADGQIGEHAFRTECSDSTNSDLHHAEGRVTITPYRGNNPLYRHGPVRVASDRRHFEHSDGTPFLWLGDTWWMGLTARLAWPQGFQTLVADRKTKGFNVIQIVAGLYPEMAPLDPHGVNEAGLPWTSDYHQIRPEYFDAADRRLQYLVDNGLTPCIVGAWGYFLPTMGRERLEQHWRYLIARYGALPVIWCVAGEVNLPYYKVAGFPFEDAPQVRGWTDICRYVKQTDPYHRVLTVHPTGLGRLSARYATLDQTLLDYDMLQTGHGGLADLRPTLDTLRMSYEAAPTLPIVEGEVNYEALFGGDNNNAAIQRLFVWTCLLSGAAGYTYGGNGIWQVNLDGQPSITMGNYANLPWEQAMRLPGSQHVGLARKLLLKYPWQRFTPHPEWASFSETKPLTLEGSAWIWFPEGNPREDAPVAKRYFRRAFTLPVGKTVTQARLKMSADDVFTVFLNGQEIGHAANWHEGGQFDDLPRLLHAGQNVLAVMAENAAAPVARNPAGLIAKLEWQFADGTSETIVTDTLWRTAQQDAVDWREQDFDDGNWQSALRTAEYGQGPWGQVGREENVAAPACAGIPSKIRMIYLPRAASVTVTHLEPGKSYHAVWLDPITGQSFPLDAARGDATSVWVSPAPPHAAQDWVLALTRAVR